MRSCILCIDRSIRTANRPKQIACPEVGSSVYADALCNHTQQQARQHTPSASPQLCPQQSVQTQRQRQLRHPWRRQLPCSFGASCCCLGSCRPSCACLCPCLWQAVVQQNRSNISIYARKFTFQLCFSSNLHQFTLSQLGGQLIMVALGQPAHILHMHAAPLAPLP